MSICRRFEYRELLKAEVSRNVVGVGFFLIDQILLLNEAMQGIDLINYVGLAG
jgi:hypothetical protein